MKRENWIDTAKGFGIVGVIIGHITTPYLTVWIYTFHIPLFFFLSGYLFHNTYAPLLFFKRKIKTLIVPYFFLVIPVVLNELFSIEDFDFRWYYAWDELTKALIQKRYSPLWFISSLFGVNVLFYLISKLHNQYFQLMLVFNLSFSSFVYWKCDGDALPWNLDITLFVLPFMMLGRFLYNVEWMSYIKNRKCLFLLLFFVGNVLFGAINYYLTGRKTDLFFSDVDIVLLTFMSAICGIMFICLLSILIKNRILCYIGRNSLLIFAWHLIVYDWLGYLYDYLEVFQSPLPMYMIFVRDAVSLICIIAILIPINELILNSRLRLFLGK